MGFFHFHAHVWKTREQYIASVATWSLLLAGLLVTLLIAPSLNDPDHATALAGGLFGLSAMGVQSAFVRLLMRGIPSTSVMTTNTTQVAIDATEILLARLWTSRSVGFPTRTDIGHAGKRLAETVPIMLAFLGGTIAGAAGRSRGGCRLLGATGRNARRADHVGTAPLRFA